VTSAAVLRSLDCGAVLIVVQDGQSAAVVTQIASPGALALIKAHYKQAIPA
jgi:hypothetical protein